jgi:UDP-4-amino-4,6-dideoxy-N-acetyl-beta-L-altrosamine transaminase
MGVVKMLPYARQLIEADDVDAVVAQLKDDWLTQGPTIKRFEDALAEATGARFVVAVSSGTAALHLACLAAGVGPGDVGITTDITFVASANAIRYCGGVAHLVDVDPQTALLSLSALESKLGELRRAGQSVRVVIPVDFAGAVPDLAQVRRLAASAGALVIEDAAHSLGATYGGGTARRAAGAVDADMAILSFHPVKHITTGEGGAVTTNDPALYQRLCDLRTHGITKDPARLTRNDGPWYYEQHGLGFNYRITDLQCALGLSQARKLDAFVARRRALAARYDQAFSERRFAGSVLPLAVPANVRSAYHLYVIRLIPSAGESTAGVAARRLHLFNGLRQRGIAPQVHYIPVHRQPDFARAGMAGGDFPGAEAFYAGCLSLPLFPAMRDDDVDRVVGAVAESLAT